MDDYHLQQLIEQKLRRSEDSVPAQVGVMVVGELVTLFGYAASIDDKLRIEKAVRSIPGVVTIANEIEVRR